MGYGKHNTHFLAYDWLGTKIGLDLYQSHSYDILYRGSNMSAHVLLNLLNELGQRDKMRGLPSILSLFR